ncbi:MAG: hypothetical protein KDK02_12635 [Rhodobacteraceae bacterium]|nr:hypothetical protein [Paracoccaceae bacterium]
MRRRRGLALPLILLAIPGTALAWTAANGSAVIPVSADRFEVINRASSRAPDYWCGAGDYAIAGLRTAATQRVYIHTPVGPSQTSPGARAVQFSLSPPPSGPAPQTYSLSVKTVGDSLTAAAARQYCYDRLMDF